MLPVKTTRAGTRVAKRLPVTTTRARARARAEFAILSVQKKRLFGEKNFLLCYKSNGKCLVCVHPIWDALG